MTYESKIHIERNYIKVDNMSTMRIFYKKKHISDIDCNNKCIIWLFL